MERLLERIEGGKKSVTKLPDWEWIVLGVCGIVAGLVCLIIGFKQRF
jgi:hypothetical protein